MDLLIGNNFFQLHTDGGQGRDAVGDLRALQSWVIAGSAGWVIAGSHPLLKTSSSLYTAAAQYIAQIHRCEIVPELLPGFWEGDALGVLPPKRCNMCLKCSTCRGKVLDFVSD